MKPSVLSKNAYNTWHVLLAVAYGAAIFTINTTWQLILVALLTFAGGVMASIAAYRYETN